MLSQSSFNPAEEAIVEGVPQDRDGLATADVRVKLYEPNRIELSVALNRPGFLVTSEPLYPGWKATVNGAPQPLLMTNSAFRGLALPPGTTRITMEYRPASLAFSFVLSVLAFLAAATIGLVAESRPRSWTVPVSELWSGLQLGLRRLQDQCTSAVIAKRTTIIWLSVILLSVALFYWKIVLASRYSLLTDLETVNRSYSRLQFWIFSIRHGTLPLWDPYTLGGQIGTAVFYPLHLLLALVPLGPDGLFSPHLYHLWFVVVHFLGACFMFALVREFGLDQFSAFFAGICFSLGGFVGRTARLDLLESCIWLPLIFLFLLRAINAAHARRALRNAALSGLALGMSILAGGTDIVVMQVLVVISAAIAGAKARSRSALIVGVVVAMGLAAGAIQLLPSLEYGHQVAPASEGELSPYLVVAMLIPQALHEAIGRGEVTNPYMGVLPLVLALIGIWKSWRNRWVRYLTVLAIGGFLCLLGSISLLHGLMSAVLPWLWIEVASRSLYLADFALSALAAFGVASLLSDGLQKESWTNLNRGLIAAIAVIVALPLKSGQTETFAGLSLSVLLVCLSYGVLRYVAQNRSRSSAPILMVALVLVDLNAFEGLLRSRRDDQLERLLSFKDAAKFLKWHGEPFRAENAAPPLLNVGDTFGISTIDDTVKGDKNLLNVRFRVVSASTPDPGPVYWDASWKIYENPAAYPRAWTIHQLARLNTPGFDPRQTAVLDGRVTLSPSIPDKPDRVDFKKMESNRLELEVDVKSRGLLVFSERFSQGWHAKVNASRTPVFRADSMLCAIVLPPGHYQVVLEYTSVAFYFGAILTFAAFVSPLVPRLHKIIFPSKTVMTTPALTNTIARRSGEISGRV
jgi:hypothetical protein